MTDRLERSCRSAGRDQPRLLRTHAPGCESSACPGCEPCPERHCGVCDRQHVTVDGRGTDQTCAGCIGDTRTAIRRITELVDLMTAAATERGVNSLAAMHAGPVAASDRWIRRHRLIGDAAAAAKSDRDAAWQRWLAWLDDCRDEQHPLWVLGQWDFTARDHLDQLIDGVGQVLDVPTTAAYLDQHLTRLAHDDAYDFAQMSKELTGCRDHLEQVLAVAPYTETGAPCPACGRADLEKRYADDTTASDDSWTCPKCHQWWTEHDYRTRIAAIYTGVAPVLTASQIREVYRVEEATVRKWAERGKVAKRGKDQHGRMLYDVAMVLDARDQTAKEAS